MQQEEPYKMMLFGRSKHHLECITTDFLPFDEQLHIVVADADMNLQVLQFDPESKCPCHHVYHHADTA
jgi:cleavage and polyadenylation specificity factor subunit 1